MVVFRPEVSAFRSGVVPERQLCTHSRSDVAEQAVCPHCGSKILLTGLCTHYGSTSQNTVEYGQKDFMYLQRRLRSLQARRVFERQPTKPRGASPDWRKEPCCRC